MNNKERKEREREEMGVAIEEIMRKLEDMKQKFGKRFRFIWNMELLNESCCWVEDQVYSYNSDINTKDLERTMLFLTSKYQQLYALEGAISRGDKFVVTCINEKKQPKKLKEKIRLGGVYRIDQTFVDKKGRMTYRLEGVNDENNFALLNASRFKTLGNFSLT